METAVNTRVIFSAVRTKNYVNPGDNITFDDTVTNIGNGIDPESGVFTAPVSGIYSFSISGTQGFTNSRNEGTIQVLKDQVVEFSFYEHKDFDIEAIHG